MNRKSVGGRDSISLLEFGGAVVLAGCTLWIVLTILLPIGH
jgi:hypothetical protein